MTNDKYNDIVRELLNQLGESVALTKKIADDLDEAITTYPNIKP
jgi:hypothetical protein